MSKQFLKLLVVVFAVMSVTGCTMRAYKQVLTRVDQQDAGNAGYIAGTRAPEQKDVRPTRTTYVIEVTKKDKKQDEAIAAAMAKPTTSETSSSVSQSSSFSSSNTSPNYGYQSVSPQMNEADSMGTKSDLGSEASSAGGSSYTVEKGDTLQKISKKFYNSYAKWNKIYEANKDKIANPNRIKPGIVLTIP